MMKRRILAIFTLSALFHLAACNERRTTAEVDDGEHQGEGEHENEVHISAEAIERAGIVLQQ